MPTQEISDYVTGLSSATLAGTEEVYLASDEKTTVNAISQFAVGKVYKAQISQAGTSAPTLVELVNTLGVTVTPSYGVAGVYTLSGFTGLITGLTEVNITCPDNGVLSAKAGGTVSTDVVAILTYSSGVLSNDVLSNDPSISNFGSSVITIIKYD